MFFNKIFLFLLCSFTLIACQAQSNRLGFSETPKWDVDCQPTQNDPYGKKIEDAKCWLAVTYNRAPLSTQSAVAMSYVTLLEINKNGTKFKKPKVYDANLCKQRPKRMAVDGKRIDNLSFNQQIKALSNGKQFYREIMRPWPYCNLYNETTTLTGFSENYKKLQTMWKNYSEK